MRPAAVDIGAFQLETVTSSTASLPNTATALTINGTAFDTNAANDTVIFTVSNGSVSGTVTAVTSTSLTLSLTGLSSVTGGTPLDATVSVDGVSTGSAVQVATVAPVVTSSTANLPNNSSTLTIAGSGFDTNAAHDTVTFNGGVTGSVAAATATSLTVSLAGLSGLSTGAALDATATVDGTSNGSAVQVATIIAGPPSVTLTNANLADSAMTITINGANFSTTPASDTVTFNLGVAGTVASATTTQLVVALSAPPTTLGNLTAVVTTSAGSSGSAVQVATEVNGTWTVTDSNGSGSGALTDVTLPYAVAHALSGDTINFSVTGTITASVGGYSISKNITISGPWRFEPVAQRQRQREFHIRYFQHQRGGEHIRVDHRKSYSRHGGRHLQLRHPHLVQRHHYGQYWYAGRRRHLQ